MRTILSPGKKVTSTAVNLRRVIARESPRIELVKSARKPERTTKGRKGYQERISPHGLKGGVQAIDGTVPLRREWIVPGEKNSKKKMGNQRAGGHGCTERNVIHRDQARQGPFDGKETRTPIGTEVREFGIKSSL